MWALCLPTVKVGRRQTRESRKTQGQQRTARAELHKKGVDGFWLRRKETRDHPTSDKESTLREVLVLPLKGI